MVFKSHVESGFPANGGVFHTQVAYETKNQVSKGLASYSNRGIAE